MNSASPLEKREGERQICCLTKENNLKYRSLKNISGDLRGGPVAKTLHLHCTVGLGLIPGRGTRSYLPHSAVRPIINKRFFCLFVFGYSVVVLHIVENWKQNFLTLHILLCIPFPSFLC